MLLLHNGLVENRYRYLTFKIVRKQRNKPVFQYSLIEVWEKSVNNVIPYMIAYQELDVDRPLDIQDGTQSYQNKETEKTGRPFAFCSSVLLSVLKENFTCLSVCM